MPWSAIAAWASTSTTSGKRSARSASGSIRGIPRPAWIRIGTLASSATFQIDSAAALPNPNAWARGCSLIPRAPSARQRSASATGSSPGSSRQYGYSRPSDSCAQRRTRSLGNR